MISILVPVYNYDISNLANELNCQITALNTEIEVVFYDDCSTDVTKVELNESVASRFGFRYFKSTQNKGIAEALNFLSTLAKYDWLIFLDADVIPKSPNFIKTYSEVLGDQKKVFCGGLLYQDEIPEKGILRWKYGRKYEVQSIEQANKNSYQNFKGCNFFLHKSVFGHSKFIAKNDLYGAIDTSFGIRLKNKNITIEFIENRVYHLGLEDNQTYIDKTNLVIESFFDQLKTNQFDEISSTKLIKTYLFLKQYKLHHLVYLTLSVFQKKILKNLLSKNPSTNLFQLYKLFLLLHKLKLNK
jgi:glycosyltransferase involved in cell wall biosynthesis